MGYIYIYKYNSQKVAICSLWTVCPCFTLTLTQSVNSNRPRLSLLIKRMYLND